MKRVLSLLLVFCMLVAIGSFTVSADTIEAKTYTYLDGLLYNSAGSIVNGPILSGKSLYPTGDSTIRKSFTLRNGYYGTGVYTVSEDDNSYYNFDWSDVQSLYRTNFEDYLTDDISVLSFSYKIRIPEDSSDKFRKTALMLYSAETGSSGTTANTEIYIDYDDKVFSVSYNSYAMTEVSSKTKLYNPGSWVPVELRAYLVTRESKKYVDVGVYIDGEQVFYGNGNYEFSNGLALRQINFVTETGMVDSSTITYNTHYDDITISTLPASYAPANGVVFNKSLTLFDGSLLKSGGSAITSIPVTDNGYFYPIPNAVGVKKAFIVRGTNANSDIYTYGTGVTKATESDDEYYVVNWSDIQNNYRTSIQDYMTSSNPVASVSYHIRIPAISSDKQRSAEINFTNDPNSDTEFIRSKFNIIYDDNKFSVNAENMDTVTSKTKTYTPDTWVKVEVRAFINDEGKLEAAVYVGDEQIYYGTGDIDYSDVFALRQINFKTETTELSDGSVITYDTHYDDIEVAVLLANSIPTTAIKLSLKETSNGVESKAKVLVNNSNLCMVTAVFDESNKMQKLWIDTTLEDGFFSIPITDSQYLKAGYVVKSFVFNSLQSAIPQVKSKDITLTSE